MSTKKVLEVVERLDGGVYTHVKTLINAISPSCSMRADLFVGPLGKLSGIQAHMIQSKYFDRTKGPNLFRTVFELHAQIRLHNYLIMHAHSTFSGLVVRTYQLLFDRTHQRKYVYTPHAFFSEKPMGRVKFRVVQYIERWMLRGFDTVIHVSSEEAEFSENYRLVRQDKIRIVPNGLPDIIPNLSFKDKNLIVMVGRVDKQKNPERFIAIANSVHAIIPSIKFLYIGGGELLPKLQDECSKLSFVDFVGPQDGVQAFLEKASLFMSTSLYEGLPFAVIEAMRSGLPVALSKVTGHAELVDGDGILFRLSDSDQKIADRIANLMNDSENLKLMGEKSRDLFLKKYTSSIMVGKILDIYRILLM